MSSTQPFMGEIKMIAFPFAPKGWAVCNGRLMSIQQNQALFSILGTTYGGDGVTTFALPNLQSRVPMHWGTGIGLSDVTLGQVGGEENHILNVQEMPAHLHVGPFKASTAAENTKDPTGATWTTDSNNPFSTSAPNTPMAPTALMNTGNNQGHPNLQPYLVITYVIALQGIFPSRN